MNGLTAQSLIHTEALAIDDCWNRIGVYGNKSCPLLAEHIHCRNCSVYSAAATRLLDRYSFEQDGQDLAAAPDLEHKVATRSLMMFRMGGEWLGLATGCLDEVAPMQSIHSLPHQRSRALLGVANVRGTLVPCLSLVELLGLDPTVTHNIEQRVLNTASLSGEHASAKFTRGVLPYKARSLRWLDEEQLLSAITRSLT